MIIFFLQAGRHVRQVQLKEQAVRRGRTRRRWIRIVYAAIVVEHAHDVVRQKTRIMLPRELRAAFDGEAALLATELPDDPSGRLVYSIDGRRIAPGHQNIRRTVREPDGIEMIGIPYVAGRRRARRRLIGIGERDVGQRIPKKYHDIRP